MYNSSNSYYGIATDMEVFLATSVYTVHVLTLYKLLEHNLTETDHYCCI